MKGQSFLQWVFLLVGVGILVGAGYLYQREDAFLDKALRADGVVVDLALSHSSSSSGSSYHPVVRFTPAGGKEIEFRSSAGTNPPSYSRGEHVTVLYTPDNPQNAEIDSFFSLWGAALIVGGVGAVFFLIGVGLIQATRSRKRREAFLRRNGITINTKLQAVERNEQVRVNGQHPYVVLTQWQDPATSKVHVFRSDNLWYDPTSYITDNSIKVLIERNNPSKYLVDLSFLPEAAG